MKRNDSVDEAAQRPVREPAGADTNASSRLADAAHSGRALPDIPAMEWVFAVIGAVLVAGTLGFIAWQGFAHNGAPPEVSFKVHSIAEIGSGYLVTVHATNRGDTTAADVKVEGELSGPAGSIEKSEMSFTYLPPRSPKTGGMFFANDPRTLTLRLSAKGYESP